MISTVNAILAFAIITSPVLAILAALAINHWPAKPLKVSPEMARAFDLEALASKLVTDGFCTMRAASFEAAERAYNLAGNPDGARFARGHAIAIRARDYRANAANREAAARADFMARQRQPRAA